MNALLLVAAILCFILLAFSLSFLVLFVVVRIFRIPDAPALRIFKIFLLLFMLGLASNAAGKVSEGLVLLLSPFAIVLAVYILKSGFEISWKRSIGVYLVNTVLSLLLVAGPAMGIRAYLLQAFKIPSGAMIPTLLVGDHLFADKYTYRFRMPERGEIVIFKFPQDRETDFIKRVVALPGESISLENGVLFINGERVQDVHAVYQMESSPVRLREFSSFPVPARGDVISLDTPQSDLYRHLITNEIGERGTIVDGRLLIDGRETSTYQVQNDYLFVMGDNRDNSYDSRMWGPVSVKDVYGRALIVYWSYGKGPMDIRWDRIGKVLTGSKN